MKITTKYNIGEYIEYSLFDPAINPRSNKIGIISEIHIWKDHDNITQIDYKIQDSKDIVLEKRVTNVLRMDDRYR